MRYLIKRPQREYSEIPWKSLVIVESPAKAKTINKYLGSNFVVKSSVGHIGTSRPVGLHRQKNCQDVEPIKRGKAKRQLIRRMGVDPEHGWTARYEILPGKEKVVSELKKLAVQADRIYLATDMDREGEAIAWHLRETIGGDADKYQRVTFSEITKTAIEAAFDSPSNVDVDRVNAQQARRFLDRIVGYMVSPLLWAKIARGLSAGRVQSVAVRLVVERERAIGRSCQRSTGRFLQTCRIRAVSHAASSNTNVRPSNR